MADRRYLKRRGESWYYQRAVPEDLKARWHGAVRALAKEGLYSGDPIVVALGTRDLTDAQSERWRVNAQYQAQFDKLRERARPRQFTPADIETIALEQFHNTLQELDEMDADEAAIARFVAKQQGQLDLADPTKMHPELARIHPQLGAGRPSRVVDFVYAKIKARLAAAEARRKALAGIVPDVPQSFGRKSVDPVTLRPILPRAGSKDGPKFFDVAARYIAERQRDPKAKLTEQTREQLETTFRLFDSWSKQPCLGQIDRPTATSFLDTIAKLDPMWGRSGATKGRSFTEIFERFGNHPRGLANVTLSRHAGALSAVWMFAADRDGFAGNNPWTRQARAKGAKRGPTGKRAFTGAEIAKLLQRKPATAPNKHDTASAMPWAILIGAYSGMRLNEICSLDVDDAKEAGGIWYFDITAAKSEAGIRCVPVHSRILQAGLMEYRNRLKRGQLFPGLKPGGPDGKLRWYVSKRFTVLRRDLGLIDVGGAAQADRLDFHSLRRAAVTALKHARIPEHEVAEVLGHDHPQVTFGVYPDRHKLKELQRIVEAIRYEGLDY